MPFGRPATIYDDYLKDIAVLKEFEAYYREPMRLAGIVKARDLAEAKRIANKRYGQGLGDSLFVCAKPKG